jgi:hypothetical protein
MNRLRLLTQLVFVTEKENVNILPVRTKRRAAPTSLKEASLVMYVTYFI